MPRTTPPPEQPDRQQPPDAPVTAADIAWTDADFIPPNIGIRRTVRRSRCQECDTLCVAREYRGQRLCPECLQGRMVVCHGCDDSYDREDVTVLRSVDPNGNVRWVRYLCADCLSGDPRGPAEEVCSGCGMTFTHDSGSCHPDGYWRCFLCRRGPSRPLASLVSDTRKRRRCRPLPSAHIHSHSYRTDPAFHEPGFVSYDAHPRRLYLGFELEVSRHDSNISLDQMAEALSNGFWFFKLDGSVPDGIEIVSQPFSEAYYTTHSFREWLARQLAYLRTSGYRSYNARPSCGLHVHMSRSAFAGRWHLYKLVRLFHTNVAFSTRISERARQNIQRWCQLDGDLQARAGDRDIAGRFSEAGRIHASALKARHGEGAAGKYAAVNLSHARTVEIRIFRGTLNELSFCKALEFCFAAFHYTRDAAPTDCTALRFRRWITANQSRYPNLAAFLNRKHALADTALVASIIPRKERKPECV